MELTTFDVCTPGNERWRTQSEFVLVAYIAPRTCGGDIRTQWLEDLQSRERPEGFNYDEARKVIESAVAAYVRPAFRRKKWNPFGAPGSGDCAAFLFIKESSNA